MGAHYRLNMAARLPHRKVSNMNIPIVINCLYFQRGSCIHPSVPCGFVFRPGCLLMNFGNDPRVPDACNLQEKHGTGFRRTRSDNTCFSQPSVVQ